jgi:lipopolysaccharide export system protein LptA
MRSTRWLILAAITAIIVAVGYTYYSRAATAAHNAPPPVIPLPSGIDATAKEWHYRNSNGDCPVLDVRAKSFKQIKDPSTGELEGVNLLLFHECGKTFDHITSAKAEFDTNTGVLSSDGDVEITMGIPAGEEPNDRLVKIVSSGVKFETKTGKAYTEKPAKFTFAGGDGKSVGAEYDPNTRELQLKGKVELNLRSKNPKAPPAKIESGYLSYHERESKIILAPWAKLTRDKMILNTANAVATLDQGVLKLVEAANAWGMQDDPGRKVEYQAEQLTVDLNDDGQITKIVAERNAHLLETSATARTDIRSDRLDLEFAASEKDSALTKALATGHSIVDSSPIAKPGAQPAETRLLKSDNIELRMRAGGREIDNVETGGPGVLEFIPNRPAQPHRWLNGDKMWIVYGAENQIQSFRSVNVTTKTMNPPKDGKAQPPVATSSKELLAAFDPTTHQLARLDQTDNFRYEAGERKAQSDKATLEQAKDLMTLVGAARILDATGSASADRIVMNQKTGDFAANGHVSSTRLPDKKGDTGSAMLSNDEPMHAKANRMMSSDNGLQIHYEGNAVAWQGANRVEADRLDIDRDDEIMKATGHVVSQFVDKPKKDKSGKPLPNQTTVFTVVRAPEMTYVEEDRIAHYKGGVVLSRPNMNVKSRELKAFLKDKDSDSSLDKAFADGGVVIVQSVPGRVRTGISEHAEYYAGEEKIILEKGQPKFVDSVKGTAQGQKLTYFTNDDRLYINGAVSRRAESTIHRK